MCDIHGAQAKKEHVLKGSNDLKSSFSVLLATFLHFSFFLSKKTARLWPKWGPGWRGNEEKSQELTRKEGGRTVAPHSGLPDRYRRTKIFKFFPAGEGKGSRTSYGIVSWLNIHKRSCPHVHYSYN